ncbi:MAG: hypothetical protein AAGI11_20675 [Pseudomonadota bacterium]
MKITKDVLFSDLEVVPKVPGAYVIYNSKPIARFCGIDQRGVLDIGEAGNLQDRLRKFLACANGRRLKGHSAGARFRTLELDRVVSIDSLKIEIHESGSKTAAYKREGELLGNYLKEHKELPPLNYKYNRSADAL